MSQDPEPSAILQALQDLVLHGRNADVSSVKCLDPRNNALHRLVWRATQRTFIRDDILYEPAPAFGNDGRLLTVQVRGTLRAHGHTVTAQARGFSYRMVREVVYRMLCDRAAKLRLYPDKLLTK